jgi:beta-lactam-binding protein with PASTA domain
VNVEVSRGPELIAVPSVASADTIAEAIAIISGAGLTPGSVSGPAAGTPVGTSPGAGTLVRPGSTVNIVLG